MSLLRSIRNVAVGYTSTQVKVRNATSNDDNTASTQELMEIAELTYNNQELFFIMDMIDKRLNDKGKNWRHVLKSLVLLEYLVYNGSENVIIWCHAKFYVIKTLREFQYRDESGKDYGNAIRARAKELVSLLNNNDRLKEARRDAQSGRGSNAGRSRSGRRYQDRSDSENYINRSREDLSRSKPNRYRNERPERSERSSRRSTPEDDEDLKRAIELSKQSVQEDEKRRAQLRNASADIDKAVSISQATNVVQQHQTGLYTQEDWNSYQRAQQEYLQYQEQLAQQQQLEMQLAQQQQELAGFGQQFDAQYTGYQAQPAQTTGQATGQATGQITGYLNGQYTGNITGQQTQYTGQYGPYGHSGSAGSAGSQAGSGSGFQTGSQTGLQPLQPVKTGSNNPFAAQNVASQSQYQPSYQNQQQYQQQNYQPQQYQQQQQQQYQQQPTGQQNNPFQQQYTGIATTQMQPSHTGFGFGNAQNQNRSNGDSLIDL